MPFPFALLLLGLPILELYVMIEVGGEYGAMPVVLWIIASVMLGIHIIRAAGWLSASKIQESMLRGDMPFAAMFQAAGMVFAGILLIIPGFITDILGALLLIGPVRSGVGAMIARNATIHTAGMGAAGMSGGFGQQRQSEDGVIDGEFTVVDDEPDPEPKGNYDQITHTVIDISAEDVSNDEKGDQKGQ